MLAKVEEVQLHPTVVAFTIPLDKLDSYEGVRLVAKLLNQWERRAKTNTFKALAAKVGLYHQTVSKIANRDTKAPRLHTILMIMKGIGFSAVRFE